jgi:hypothetical protein
MKRAVIATLLLLLTAPARAETLAMEAEVLEASHVVDVPGAGAGQIRYLILHHKHEKDQAPLSEWLHRYAGARMTFRTRDGTTHAAVLQRLKHCFGRGLLLYSDAVDLKEKDVIQVTLDARQ